MIGEKKGIRGLKGKGSIRCQSQIMSAEGCFSQAIPHLQMVAFSPTDQRGEAENWRMLCQTFLLVTKHVDQYEDSVAAVKSEPLQLRDYKYYIF